VSGGAGRRPNSPNEEGKPITWRVRAAPASRFGEAEPEHQASAFYNPYELEVMAGERAALDGSERVAAFNSIDTLHEFKVLLGATIESPDEPPLDDVSLTSPA
jgi:hypothetical protein